MLTSIWLNLGLAEEDSGERKLPDRSIGGLKARFSIRRKGSMSDMTGEMDDDSAEESGPSHGMNTPPSNRPLTMHGIPLGGVALPMLSTPPANLDELPAPPEEMLPPPPPKKPETPFGMPLLASHHR